jgi:transposase
MRTDADAGVGGRTASHDLREIFNAILYLNRTGIAWRYLPRRAQATPAPGPRLRNPPDHLRHHDPHRHDRQPHEESS